MIPPKLKITSNIWWYTTQKAKPQFACLKVGLAVLTAAPQAAGCSSWPRVEKLSRKRELWSFQPRTSAFRTILGLQTSGGPAGLLALVITTPEWQGPPSSPPREEGGVPFVEWQKELGLQAEFPEKEYDIAQCYAIKNHGEGASDILAME